MWGTSPDRQGARGPPPNPPYFQPLCIFYDEKQTKKKKKRTLWKSSREERERGVEFSCWCPVYHKNSLLYKILHSLDILMWWHHIKYDIMKLAISSFVIRPEYVHMWICEYLYMCMYLHAYMMIHKYINVRTCIIMYVLILVCSLWNTHTRLHVFSQHVS